MIWILGRSRSEWMIRGSTPTHTFTVPFETDTIDELHIVYSQNGIVKVKKTKEDCKLKDRKIETTLSQEDTLQFTDAYVHIQLRVVREGVVFSSRVLAIPVGRCLEDEVI